MSPNRRYLVLLSLAGALLPSVATATAVDPPPPSTDPVVVQTSVGDAAIALPDSPAGDQLSWVLTEGATASVEDWAARLGPAALAVVTPEAARDGVADALALAGPEGFTLTATDEYSDADLLVTLVTSAGTAYDVGIVVTPEPPHLIELLQFSPSASAMAESPTGVEEIEARLAAVAPNSALLVRAVDDPGAPIVDIDADSVGPIGSAFKLYVLGAAVDAIAAGDIEWSDQLIITPELKSLPSGELQNRPDGSTTTVEEAATLMISISDNTATDLLIDLVGVEAVEAQMEEMGASSEAIDRTLPFLTTRQLFTLKWTQDETTLQRYADGDVATRRDILAGLPSALPTATDVDPATPVFNEQIEWFAAPTDLADALEWLADRIDTPGMEPLSTVLGTNPGVELDPAVWGAFAFKGGSEPGVISLSWLLTRADDQRFVVSVLASDPDAAIDELEVVSIALGAIEEAAGAEN